MTSFMAQTVAGHGTDIVYDKGKQDINFKNQRNDLIFKGAKLAGTKLKIVMNLKPDMEQI